MKRGEVITYIIGAVTFLLPIVLYFTPPTDSDGGPMLAYNLFFFFPIAFLSVILSLIIVFRLKLFKNDFLSRIMLVISIIPTLRLITLILINIYRISDEPPFDLGLDIHNNTVNLKVNDTVEINLHGFTKKKFKNNGKIIEIQKINLVPYINKQYSYKDGGMLVGKSGSYEVYYKIINDSLLIYSKGVEFSYFNKTRISLPILIKNYDLQKDIMKEINNKEFKRFIWK